MAFVENSELVARLATNAHLAHLFAQCLFFFWRAHAAQLLVERVLRHRFRDVMLLAIAGMHLGRGERPDGV